jgi:hypothetical protein
MSRHSPDSSGFYTEQHVHEAYTMWVHQLKLNTEDLKIIYGNILEEQTIASYPIKSGKMSYSSIDRNTMKLVLAQVTQDTSITLSDATGVIDEVDTTGDNVLTFDDFVKMMTYIKNV